MKKYFTVCLLFSLVILITSSCSKTTTGASPTQNVRTVTYDFTAKTTGNYSITYTGSNGNNVVESITAASWTKSVDISDITVTKTVNLTVASATINTTTQAALDITMNSAVVNSSTFTLTSLTNNSSINYTF